MNKHLVGGIYLALAVAGIVYAGVRVWNKVKGEVTEEPGLYLKVALIVVLAIMSLGSWEMVADSYPAPRWAETVATITMALDVGLAIGWYWGRSEERPAEEQRRQDREQLQE